MFVLLWMFIVFRRGRVMCVVFVNSNSCVTQSRSESILATLRVKVTLLTACGRSMVILIQFLVYADKQPRWLHLWCPQTHQHQCRVIEVPTSDINNAFCVSPCVSSVNPQTNTLICQTSAHFFGICSRFPYIYHHKLSAHLLGQHV